MLVLAQSCPDESRGLVDKDQPARVKPALILLPTRPSAGHVGTILLGGEQALFDRDPLRLEQPPHRAGDDCPSSPPQRFPSTGTAATTSPRWPLSPQTAPPAPGTSDHSSPMPQLDPEGLSNRVSPSMLAPTPASILNQKSPTRGTPYYDSGLPNPALVACHAVTQEVGKRKR